MHIVETLTERGMLAQQTDDGLAAILATPTAAYIGFDPTADSLHVGSMLPMVVLGWLQTCGHKPLALIGGATGLVGDPSGKNEARKMLTPADIAHNADGIKAQIARALRFGDGPTDGLLVNNADWLGTKNWIELLREVGPHFSINRMLSMDSVSTRLDGGGLTFLEFNYMVMQAYDFVHLSRSHGCTLQCGGQDQWGNIVMGIELSRRTGGRPLYGLTWPLVTKADGAKFGKSESGNVWLSAERTPAYAFWQFWRNSADADVGRYLGYFTRLPMDEVRALAAKTGSGINEAKEVLANEVTTLIHGRAAADAACADARKAFSGTRDVSGDSIPHAPILAAELDVGLGILVALVRAELAKSNGEARRLIDGGGVRVNDVVVADSKRTLTTADLKDRHIVLSAGKKKHFRFDLA